MPLDFQAKPSALCEARRTRSSPPCCLVCLPLSGVARLSPRLLAGNASSLVPRVPPRPESCQSDRHAVSLSCAPPTRSSQLGRTPPCGDASASLSRSARPACLQSTSDYQRHGDAIPTASALTPQHKQNARLPWTLCALWPLLTFASRFLPASVPPHHPHGPPGQDQSVPSSHGRALKATRALARPPWQVGGASGNQKSGSGCLRGLSCFPGTHSSLPSSVLPFARANWLQPPCRHERKAKRITEMPPVTEPRCWTNTTPRGFIFLTTN